MDHPVVVLVGDDRGHHRSSPDRSCTSRPTCRRRPRCRPARQARQGYDILQARFDRGALNPIDVLVTWTAGGAAAQPTAPRNLAALYGYGQRLAALPDVASVIEHRQSARPDSSPGVEGFWKNVTSLPTGVGRRGGRDDRRCRRQPSLGGAAVPLPTKQVAAAQALLASTTAPGTVLFQVAPATDPSGATAQSLSQTIRRHRAAAGHDRPRRRAVGRHPRLPLGALRPLPLGRSCSSSASPTSCCCSCCAASGCRSRR